MRQFRCGEIDISDDLNWCIALGVMKYAEQLRMQAGDDDGCEVSANEQARLSLEQPKTRCTLAPVLFKDKCN